MTIAVKIRVAIERDLKNADVYEKTRAETRR